MTMTFVEARAEREHWEGELVRLKCCLVKARLELATSRAKRHSETHTRTEAHSKLLEISRDQWMPWPVRAIARFFWWWG